MKKIITLSILISWTFILKAQTDLATRLDSLVSEAVKKDLFSGNILIQKTGNVVYEKSIGQADYDKNIPNQAETRFQIGSITKFFTKMMVLQLIEEKKLDWNTPLSMYQKEFPNGVEKKINIEHLLFHQSGLGQYYEVEGFMENISNIKSISEIISYIKKQELLFEPGTKAEYSNSGYVLLASIIEKIDNKPFGQVLKDRIFDKLGVKTADFSVSKPVSTDIAMGYLTREMGTKRPNTEMPVVAGGDGGIFMTTRDLLKVNNSLMSDNKLLTDVSKTFLFKRSRDKKDEKWEDVKKTVRFAIAGGAPGISAFYCQLPEYTIIVFSNYDEGSSEELGNRLVSIVSNRSVEPLKLPLSRFLYDMLTQKGAAYFSENIEAELSRLKYNLDDDMLLLFAGQPLLEQQKADEAIALYQFYTQKFPQIVVAWNDLGDAYLLKNNVTEAKKCFQKALILRPNNPRAKEMLEKLK